MTEDDVRRLPALVGVGKAAEALGVHRDTAYAQLRDGTFPLRPVAVGARRKFRRAEIMGVLGITSNALPATGSDAA